MCYLNKLGALLLKSWRESIKQELSLSINFLSTNLEDF